MDSCHSNVWLAREVRAMKIKTNTPELMIVTYRSTILSTVLMCAILFLACFCIAFTVSGPFVFAAIAWLAILIMIYGFFHTLRRVAVFFDRQGEVVTVRERTWRGLTNFSYPLTDLGAAIIQTSKDEDDVAAHRIALRFVAGMNQGDYPLTDVYFAGRSTHKVVDAINNWLGSGVDSPPITRLYPR